MWKGCTKNYSYFLLPLNDILQVKVTKSSQHYIINKQEEERRVEPSESFSVEQCGTRDVYLFPGDVFLKEMQYEKKSITYWDRNNSGKMESYIYLCFFSKKTSEQCRYFLSSVRHLNAFMYVAGLMANQLMLLVLWVPECNLASSHAWHCNGDFLSSNTRKEFE